MKSNKRAWLIVLLLVAAAPLAWWLASPLFIDRTVEEGFVYASSAVVPEGMTRAEVESVMAEMAGAEHPMEEAMPEAAATAVAVKRGTFRDADSFHRGSGVATIYRIPDGTHVLRLEDFRVTNGPELHVLLVGHGDPMSRGELKERGELDLGDLKGNVGNQNYEIPADVDVAAYNSVVIYCKPFSVIFSVAPLTS